MSYQVLARKWRPKQFDEVVGQPAVTRTLKNAIAHGRIAQAFVFAGPRGVGKTTTARILARALNCVNGPTTEPCGSCDPCREIADGRDIDVLEIDAATHTGVDNVREVIIAGLAIVPVRDRYKVFIIDEVHQLSGPSFNALLKSIEEPPPHVVFMMATTALDKIPDTVLSRSQVFEFKLIAARAIAEKLRAIADAEGIAVADEALRLVSRAADGSMRDAQSAFDQVIAFAGATVTVEDVATVLGLVGRDLLLDAVTAVADENAAAAFDLAGRAVDLGYDLRLVCRELSRVVRDLLVLSVDPARIDDPEIAAEGERERLRALAARFSREDLLRAFDVLTRGESEIRHAAQPRYHLEMTLLRWIHLRKLVPLTELLGGAGGGPRPGGGSRPAPAGRTTAAARPAAAETAPGATPARVTTPTPGDSGKDRFMAEIRRVKPFLYNTVVAQAQTIEFGPDRITFTFLPAHRTLREQIDQNRPLMESTAAAALGRRMAVTAVEQAPAAPAAGAGAPPAPGEAGPVDLRAEALSDTAVQAMLDVFPARIDDVEEM